MATSVNIINAQVGELAVSAELLSRGHVVCAMLPGYPAIDLMTLDKTHNVRKLIQVKFVPKRKPSWLCTSAIEQMIDPRLVYVFVCKTKPPCVGFDYYCIIEADVRSFSKQQNSVAVAKRTAVDPSFVDNNMRRIDLSDPKYVMYKNNFTIF